MASICTLLAYACTCLRDGSDFPHPCAERELLVTAHSVLNAGFETTMSALANGLQGLLSQPGAWAALVAEPSRSAAVAEEALRWEHPPSC